MREAKRMQRSTMQKKGFNYSFIVLTILLAGHTAVFAQEPLIDQLAGKIDMVVALDESGDYTSINAAINAVPNNSSNRTVIFVKNGNYVEKVEIPGQKRNITMIGEHIDSTIISYNDYSGSGEIYDGIISSANGNEIGTSTSHTMYIDTENFILLNLTVENTAGPVGQAVAINLGGDKIIISHCRILGNQDTYYTWGAGRFYTHNTFIEGNVDFIFGRGVAYFDSCWIYSNRNNSDITAASTDADWEYGYIFNNCRVSPKAGVSGVSMGRPWKTYAQTVFMNSYLDDHIKSGGWSDWGDRSKTCYYAEYGNYGPGSDTAGRVSWAHYLTDQEAASYTIENIFGADVNPSPFSSNWDPDLYNDEVYQILDQHIGRLIADTTYNQPFLKDLALDGITIEDFHYKSRFYTVTLPEGTTDVPEISYELFDMAASVEVETADSLPGKGSVKVISRDSSVYTYNISFKIDASTGFNEITPGQGDNMGIHILNNPFGHALNIEIAHASGRPVWVKLYSVTGKAVMNKQFNIHSNPQKLELNTGTVKKGMYILTVEERKGTLHTFKLVK